MQDKTQPIEAYFDEQETNALKRTLTKHGLKHWKPTHDDKRMTLHLSKYLVIYFYKKWGEKLYSLATTPNICNAKYTGYVTNLDQTIELAKQHLKKRHVPYENSQGNNRPLHKIVRDLEEALNEYGVEVDRVESHRIYVGDTCLSLENDHGMASLTGYGRQRLPKTTDIQEMAAALRNQK